MTYTYSFGGMLYPTSRTMHVAIAEAWLSGDGSNTRADMLASLAEASNEELADEVLENWEEIDTDSTEEGDKPEGFAREELVAAFAAIRADFDTHFLE